MNFGVGSVDISDAANTAVLTIASWNHV